MVRKSLTLVLALLVGLIAGKYAYRNQPAEIAPSQVLLRVPTPPSLADKILSRPIADLALDNVPEPAALRSIADAANANIAFLWDAADQNIDPSLNHQVTLHLHNTTLRAALDAVLKLDTERVVTYQMLDEVIFVTFNGSSLITGQFARIYDVRDIVTDYLRYEIDPQLPSYDWSKGPPGQHYIEAMQKFVLILKGHISQLNYNDGIQEVAGRMIVVTDSEGHRKVEHLLDVMRSVSKTPHGIEQVLQDPGQAEPRKDR